MLNKLFDKIYIPCAVLQEITEIDKPEMKIDLSGLSFIPLDIANKMMVGGLLGRLHIGEAEVMIGAIEKGIGLVVLDENLARNKAKQFGLEVTGTLGILLKARKHGLIEEISEEISKLENAGMYLSEELIKQVLGIDAS
ncbi:MAG: DUF3368 domain-containing protein [Peptococcaceae bacterium]|nr:DUF3368 domain-containing protein [Peptococcaceae bacterium]